MHTITRPVWAEINLDNLAHNMREVRRVTRPESKVTAVIKADGYGHGAAVIGKTLLENGADRFAVATLSEAIQLRKSYPDTEILILGFTPVELADRVVDNNLIQTLYSLDTASEFGKIAEGRGTRVKIHIKLDTGMSRIGMQTTAETVDEILEISKLPGVELEGMYTHFAAADETDKTFTHQQAAKYQWVVDELAKRNVSFAVKHVSNSAGIIDLPEYNHDMVRAGIMLYGLYPSDDVNQKAVDLKEVMTLKARISHVKELEPGRGVSYGLKYVTDAKEKIATLPIGYADGYTRMLTDKSNVLVQGKRVPVVGRICMDQCMINVTGMDVSAGDTVTLFGGDEPDKIWINEVAAWLGTINYEIVCMIDKRVPRVYTKNGVICQVRDYILEL